MLEDHAGAHDESRQSPERDSDAQTVYEARTNRQADRHANREEGNQNRQNVQKEPLDKQHKHKCRQEQKERAKMHGRGVTDKNQTKARKPERQEKAGPVGQRKGSQSAPKLDKNACYKNDAHDHAQLPLSSRAHTPDSAQENAHSQGCARAREYNSLNNSVHTRNADGAHSNVHESAQPSAHREAHLSTHKHSDGQAHTSIRKLSHTCTDKNRHNEIPRSQRQAKVSVGVTARNDPTITSAKGAVLQKTPNDKNMYNNPQTRYNLRDRHPQTGQVSAQVKKERKNSLSSSESKDSTEDDMSERDSYKSSDSEYLPDIPPVVKRKRKPVRQKKLISNRDNHKVLVRKELLNGSKDQDPRKDGSPKHYDRKHSHVESVKGLNVGAGSPHSESGKDQKLMRSDKKNNTKVMTDTGTSQHEVATERAHRYSSINKHAGQIDSTGNQQGNKSDKPKKLDWAKFKKIITSKPLVNGKSYLCAWVNRAPQWVKGSLIPEQLITEYERRIQQRKIMHQLRRAYGNLN